MEFVSHICLKWEEKEKVPTGGKGAVEQVSYTIHRCFYVEFKVFSCLHGQAHKQVSFLKGAKVEFQV